MMLVFNSLPELIKTLGPATKWRRVADAIARAAEVQPEVTLSIGDSLTYRLTSGIDCPQLTGHRRYLEVRAVVEGSSTVEVAQSAALEAVDDYSDLTDRQHFTGRAASCQLSVGQIMVVDRTEAVRDVAVSGRVVIARVTVEDDQPHEPAMTC